MPINSHVKRNIRERLTGKKRDWERGKIWKISFYIYASAVRRILFIEIPCKKQSPLKLFMCLYAKKNTTLRNFFFCSMTLG